MYATLLIALTTTLIAQQNPEAIQTGETVLAHAFGDRGLTLADGRAGVPAAMPASYTDLVTALKSNDVEGLRRLIAAGRLTLIPVGARVLVREVKDYYDPDMAEIRILVGPDRDEIRCLPAQFLTRNPRLATSPKAKAAKPKRPIRKGANPKAEAPAVPGPETDR